MTGDTPQYALPHRLDHLASMIGGVDRTQRHRRGAIMALDFILLDHILQIALYFLGTDGEVF
ncbi:MAG: hypothetical protein ACTXOO_01530 [Sodalis sp. (in: enterobacteria)]